MVAIQPARASQQLIGTQRVQQNVEARRRQAELQAQRAEADFQQAQERLERARADAEWLAQVPVSNYNFEALQASVDAIIADMEDQPVEIALRTCDEWVQHKINTADCPLTPEDVHDIRHIIKYAFFKHCAKRDSAKLADHPLFAEVVEMEMNTKIIVHGGGESTLREECIIPPLELAKHMFKKKRDIAMLAPMQSGKCVGMSVACRFARLLRYITIRIHCGRLRPMLQAINKKLPNFTDAKVVQWDNKFKQALKDDPQLRDEFLSGEVHFQLSNLCFCCPCKLCVLKCFLTSTYGPCRS